MKSSYAAVKFRIAVAICGAGAGVVNAQDTTSTAPTGGLEEVVVTATKREENLQKVPIAISAFSENQLAAARIEGIQDLDLMTPGLTMTNTGVGQTPYIRGVGSSDGTPGQEVPIAMYIDGVYQPTVWTNAIPFNNVERVEVLKGPQGTLFGRNATGGLIHMLTKDPVEEFNGNASLSYGNFDTVTAKAYATGRIVEGVAADIAGYYYDEKEGWGRNLATGNPTFQSESYALRSKWLFNLGDQTKITLIGDYRDEDSGNGYVYRQVPGSIAADGSTATPGFYDVNYDVDFNVKSKVVSGSGRIEHEFEHFTFSSLSAYQEVDVSTEFDNDATTSYTVHASVHDAKNNTFSQEFQVSSNPSSSIRWIAGLYYLDMKGGWFGPKGLQIYGDGVVPGGLGVNIINKIDTKSYAAFSELGFDLSSRTGLTIGARYTRDERRLVGKTVLDGTPPGNTPIAVLGTVDTETHFAEPTYRLLLDHDFTDDVMGYASYSRGFKSGNFNTVNPANPPFKPEILDAYEVGLKSRFLNQSIQLNAAAFYYDYKNLQLVENVGNITNTVNAAASSVQGIEIDATARPIEPLEFRVGFTYLDGEYKDFPNASCFFPAPRGGNLAVSCDASGLPVVRTPEYQWNLSADYSIPTHIGALAVNATYYNNSGVIMSPESRLRQGPYDVVNGSVSWTSPDARYGLTLFGRNLLDERYAGYMVAQALGDTQVASPPRTYGLELRVNF